MKELKDIVLKKGDLVYFKDGTTDMYKDCDFVEHTETVDEHYYSERITKIERPVKYETIYEAPKEILDKEEKEYLENFLRPFRRKVMYISKNMWSVGREYIIIWLSFNEDISLPSFKKDNMYKGMELDKEYTLEELGLFKGE